MKDLTQATIDENSNYMPVKSRVRVRETGVEGRIAAVMPDKFGAPWSVQVKFADGSSGIFGPHEIERVVDTAGVN